MVSGIVKVSANVISLGLRPQLITLASALIIPDITKILSNYCLLLITTYIISSNNTLSKQGEKFMYSFSPSMQQLQSYSRSEINRLLHVKSLISFLFTSF